MTYRDFVDRYGLALGVLAALTLVIMVLPGNADRSSVDTVGGEFGSSGDDGLGAGNSAVGSSTETSDGPATTQGPSGGAPNSGVPGADGTAAPDGQPGATTNTTQATGNGDGDGGSPGEVRFGQGPHCDSGGRQIGISGYMPPCVEWTGTNNGGATARGVDEDTIKLAVWFGQEDPATRQTLSATRLNDPPGDVERIYEALRRYYNNHYQTYGREVVFVPITASGDSKSDEAMLADAIKIAEEIGAFAAFTGNALAPMPTTLARELAQRGVICICTTSLTREFYTELPPLIWSSLPTINEYAVHASEYAAKRMSREPAEFAGAGTVGKPRVYCLLAIQGVGETVDPEFVRRAEIFRNAFAERGLPFKTEWRYFYDPGSNQQDVTAMIAHFKNEGCTSLVPLVDPIQPILITKEATKQLYFPEWFIVGTGLSDTTTIGRFYDQQQWEHAFGISPLWVTWDRVENSSGFNEYHHMRPNDNKGDEGVLVNVYRAQFQTMWTGIHMAGPNLTSATFAEGMYAYPATGGTPASPLVFRTRESPTEIKDFSEIWWDPDRIGPDERSETARGMMVRADGGQRYDAGEWPQSPPSRNQPVTVTAEQGNNVDHYSDGHTHDKRCLSCPG